MNLPNNHKRHEKKVILLIAPKRMISVYQLEIIKW